MDDKQITDIIQGITADSRMVQPGWLFAAFKGKYHDGVCFIDDAIRQGASHILAAPGTTLPDGADATLIIDEDPRRRFSLLAAQFYNMQPGCVVAATGTSGKTSCVNFCRQMWEGLGHHAASLGTLGIVSRLSMKKGALTTPDPVTLQAELADLAAAGITHMAMEASSIGVDQRRLDGVALKAASFTNLSLDHLDYHGDMEAYYQAKKRLFTTLLPAGAPAVIWVDDDYGHKLADELKGTRPLVRIGRAGLEIKLINQTLGLDGQNITVEVAGQTYSFDLPLVGTFQGQNALVAAGLVMATEAHVGFDKIVPLLEKLSMIPGRMQYVGQRNGAGVYVDYAHKPHGLEMVLGTLRAHCNGKLWVVFGCGGDRDKSKRAIMGDIATRLADKVIITDDNPRSEDAAKIRTEIAAGAPGAMVIGDRRAAIRHAAGALEAGDVLLIAGKGHETGQIVAEQVLPFDDVQEAKDAINAV